MEILLQELIKNRAEYSTANQKRYNSRWIRFVVGALIVGLIIKVFSTVDYKLIVQKIIQLLS